MADLLEKTRKITSILKRSEEQMQEDLPYNAITRQLADIIHCNACIINSKGRLLGYFMRYRPIMTVWKLFSKIRISQGVCPRSHLVYETEANLPVTHDLTIFPVETKDDFPDGLTTIAPIHVSGIRLGSLIIWRNDKEFADDDLILVEIASTVVGSSCLTSSGKRMRKIRRRTAVTMAVNTLSYSELRAVSAIWRAQWQ